jgi:CubicO group peptidase (beta-lactamase class C family)
MDTFCDQQREGSPVLSRRTLIRGVAGMAAVAAVAGTACSDDASAPATATAGAGTLASNATGPATGRGHADRLFAELDEKIREGMETYAIPGVAVGVCYDGQEFLRGYGVTSVDGPEQVGEDTLFRIASTTKTFTGTAVMCLVDAGQLDLDARVRTYLPDFATEDRSVAEVVTVRQLLNHTPGWLGDDYQDFGRGDDARTRYVAGMAGLPQLTPPGSTFFYNNAAVVLAGHVVEAVGAMTYEQAVQELVLDPLQLDHTRFFTDEVIGYSIAGSHTVDEGKAVLSPSSWYVPRTLQPTGGLISTARDQLSYLRFHLGDGTAPDGKRVLSRRSLDEMRSNPGPGGTLNVELDGMGVTFQLRPSAEGVRIVQHGGDVPGQHSGFLFVPERDFGLTMLTNSDDGPQLLNDFFTNDWALSRFAGLHNEPASPQTLDAGALAAYVGRYTAESIESDGQRDTVVTDLTADQGRLRLRHLGPDGAPVDPAPGAPGSLAFYRDDYVLMMDSDGRPIGPRANFVRSADGDVAWLRFGGRLNRKVE